jgi:hypothetical protein
VYFDAAQHVVFSVGIGPNPQRGDTDDHVSIFSVTNPKAPTLLNTQTLSASIQNVQVDQSGLLPVYMDSGPAIQSWRYDPATHSIQQLGSKTSISGVVNRTMWLLPNQQFVIVLSDDSTASGTYTSYIDTFRRDPSSGALSKSSTFSVPGQLDGAVVSRDGRYLVAHDFQNELLYVYAIDQSSGSVALVSKNANPGVWVLYKFVDATHILGRAKTDNSDRLTVYNFNPGNGSVTAGSTLQLTSEELSLATAGNTIYVAEAGPSALIEMIAFDPASASLRVIGSVYGGASSVDVNPTP